MKLSDFPVSQLLIEIILVIKRNRMKGQANGRCGKTTQHRTATILYAIVTVLNITIYLSFSAAAK